MLNNEIKHKSVHQIPMPSAEEINQEVGIPRVVQELDEKGRLVSKLVFEVTPIEKLNEGLKVDDFAIEILLQNGYDFHRLDVNNQSFDNIDRVSETAKSLPLDKEVIESVKPYVKEEN